MERNKNKIKNSKINLNSLDSNKLNWGEIVNLNKKDVDDFLRSEKGMEATYDTINEGYNKYCKANGLDPDKPEEWPSAK